VTRKQFLAVLAALVVLAAAAAGIAFSDRLAWSSGDSRAGQRAISGLKVSDVAEIAIRDVSGELHLVRGKTGWSVRERADFAADTDRVAALLVKLAEMKIVQSEPLPESRRARFDLVEPKDSAKDTGTSLELKDAKGASLGRLLLGKKIMKGSAAASPTRGDLDATGRYLTVANDAGTMLAVGDPLSQAEAKPQDWLAKELLRVEGTKTVTSSKGWTVTRDTESMDWKLAGSKERPDLQKATDLASSLGWINLVDVVPEPAKADTGLDRPVNIEAKTFDGLSYTLRIGKETGGNYYLRISVAGAPAKTRTPAKNEKAEDKAKNDKEFEERSKKLIEKIEHEKTLDRWVYLVAKTTVDPLLRDRKQLLPEKKKPTKKI
jgi:uncharacterized protein DUF4340